MPESLLKIINDYYLKLLCIVTSEDSLVISYKTDMTQESRPSIFLQRS